MPQFLKQIIATVFFALLVGVPFVIRPYYDRTRRSSGDESVAMRQFGLYFTEKAKESGIDFKHTAPALDPKIQNIMPQIASMGAGAAVADFNNDGWADLYLTNSGRDSKNALYKNNKDGTFTEVGESAGVADFNREGASMGAVWGDYDNDGWEDLLVYKWGESLLFHNEKGERFTRVETAGFPKHANINAGIWFDYDRDGRLDIFLGGYFREDLDLWNLKDTKIMPESFEYAKNGGRNYLYRNLGDGRFEETAFKAGLDSTRWTLAASAADINKDGFADLFISNDYGVSELYINDQKGGFVDVSEKSGVGFAPKSGMNASFGDVLNNGSLAIYESNIYEEGNLLQGNNLWVPKSDSGQTPTYGNLAPGLGVENGGWSWSAQFGDLNNDGALDLFVANGYVSADRNGSYWYDFATVTGGNESIISDTKNWADMKGRSLSGYQVSRVWLNDGKGRFTDAAKTVGVRDEFDGRAVAFADFSNRGVLDVVVASQNAPLLLYRSEVASDRNWIEVDLVPKANESPIGTSVTIHWNGKKQTTEVFGGSGFCAQNQRRVHFGLGAGAKIDRAEIRWPDGTTQIFEIVPTNQIFKAVQKS
ncbi:MAG: CRTAC1 family protein [Pyrinomonadaceae bacterium]